MGTANFNMDDPAKQESVRRGHHRYDAAEGKHGSYKPAVYKFQEYPKMLGKYPKPEYRHFKTVNGVEIPGDIATVNFQAAMTEWDAAMTASIVHSKAEEVQWLKENG